MANLEEHEVSYGAEKKIFYLAAGPTDGPLIIFLHGWPGVAVTWKAQLTTFAALGFRVVAPDMPGYGNSTARRVLTDYAQENILPGLLALLADTGREAAVWVAHDWGCGSLWTLAATHPHVCRGAVNMCVPYRALELGLEELLKTVERDIYPEDQYPYGQWSYQVFYEQSFDAATEWFDMDVAGGLKALWRKGSSKSYRKPAMTANVVKDGGWLGGRSAMAKPPSPDQVPLEGSVFTDEAEFQEIAAGVAKNGFWCADAYYMNHKANRAYNLKNAVNGGVLHMPVLFIHAKWDSVCETSNPKIMEPMRSHCRNLTEVTVEAGHFVAQEKPQETNAAMTRWLLEDLRECWPGFWNTPFVKQTKSSRY